MDAIKFIQERNRMCATYTPKNCEGCPADNYGGDGIACIMIDKIDADRFVPIVEEWAATHLRKTRQREFLQRYPHAKIEPGNGILELPPCFIEPAMRGHGSCRGIPCINCRREYWGQEVE